MFRIMLPDCELIFGHGQDLYDQFCPIDLPLPNITLDLAADFPHRYAGQINYAKGISSSAASSSSSVPSSSGVSRAARGISDPKARVAQVPTPLAARGRMSTAGGKREPSNDSQHPP